MTQPSPGPTPPSYGAPQGGPQGHPMLRATPPPAARGLAIAALVIGIVAFLSGLVPVWGIIAGVAAAALGIVGLVKGQTKWMGILALVLGGLAVVASAFTTFATAALLNSEVPKPPAASTTPRLTADATTSPASSASATAEPPPSATEEAPAPESDYAVTIDGSRLIKDYKGRTALVVDLTFTNNSDEPATFMWATRTKAFQDGIELESMVIADSDDYSARNSTKEIKPGKSLRVQDAFLLDGKDDVEIVVTELISFDDTPLATAVISVG